MDFKTSRGTEVRIPILLLRLTGVAFICAAISASATVTPVATITFNDETNVLSVSPSGSGSCGISIIAEYCTVTLTPPSGYSFGSTTLPLLYLIGEGTGVNAKVSDSLVFLPVYNLQTHVLTSVIVTFLSDLDSVPALPCPWIGAGGCKLIENGGVQTAGIITWTKAGSPNMVDAINFQSNIATAPEPANLLLFGSGLGIAVVFLRRRRRLVTPSV
jgi:hypothetical protein